MINTIEKLEGLVGRARDAGRVALDTEFVWERTYFARLGLVQVALPGGECQLVDPPALANLSALGQLLADADVVKVLHDAVQDLQILCRATGAAPRGVFDTRLVAGFCGMGGGLSLHDLLAQVAGVQLSKDQQRTNWLRRPLTEKQKRYAENDVRHLLDAQEELVERVRAVDNERWMRLELEELDRPEQYQERPPREQYRRIKGAQRLDRRQLAVLLELAAYREQQAAHRDLPRAWLFGYTVLLALARIQPAELSELEQVKGLGARAIKHRGPALLRCVARGLELPSDACPPLINRPAALRGGSSQLDSALALLQDRCEVRAIDPALVASRTELRALLADGPGASAEDHRMLRGWRAELVGRELLARITRQKK